MPTEAPNLLTDPNATVISSESTLPGGSVGLTRMAEAFEKLAKPMKEGVKPPAPAPAPAPAKPPAAATTQAPAQPLEAPSKPTTPTPDATAKPASPLDFKRPGAEASPAPAEAPKGEADIPAEIKSPAQQANWRALQASRDAADKRATEAESRIAALTRELESSKAKAVDSQQMELLRKENEELSRRLEIAEVTLHPRFQSYFIGGLKNLTDQVKEVAGPNLSGRVLNILAGPDTPERGAMLIETISELPIWEQEKVKQLAFKLDQLRIEKEQAIADAPKARQALLLEEEQTKQKAKQERERSFNSILAAAQDPKAGLEVLAPKDGDEPHNASVRAAVEQARAIYDGKLDSDDFARAAMWAAAAPLYRQAVFTQAALIKQYEDQIKTLSAATPSLDGKPAGEEPTKPKSEEPFVDRVLSEMNWRKQPA